MKRLISLLIAVILVLALVPMATAQQSGKVFIQAKALAEMLSNPNLRIIDCRRDVDLYNQGHIPGAVFMNVMEQLRTLGAWDTVGVRRSLEEQEELFGRQLGIGNETMVVLYDDIGWDATRLFWELRYTGHDNVALLYGGFPEWQARNLPVTTDIPQITPQLYTSNARPELLATANYILKHSTDPNVVLVDVRPPAQFKGEKMHPKAKLAGRIPGAVNVFTLSHWDNKTYLKDPEEVENTFLDAGVSKDKEVIVYCNTGYFASNTFFILKALGYDNVRVYDYSWVEWSAKEHLPKVLPAQ